MIVTGAVKKILATETFAMAANRHSLHPEAHSQDMHLEKPATGIRILRVALLPLLIAASFGLAYTFHLERYLSFQALADNREALLAYVQTHAVIAAAAFVALYVAVSALALPGAALVTIAGGFLFGIVAGTIYVVVGATIGATILFLVANTSFGAILRSRTQGALGKLRAGFQDNAFSYLLFLRLVPAFPFWLVNLAAALLGVSLRVFVAATFLGIIPGSAVYVSVGNGLGAILARGETPNFGIIFAPPVLLPLLGLSILALVPVGVRHWRKRNTTGAA